MRKLLEKSLHDAVMTVLILAQKGKIAFITPFVPRELTYIIMSFVIITRKNSFFGRKVCKKPLSLVYASTSLMLFKLYMR